MGNPSERFFLGNYYDLKSGKMVDKKLTYDPPDLTTHAVVTGMTGSGKTGLCIGLLEEAAMQGIPAIIIDPKGDLTNLILHFPELSPSDFQPWVDPDAARRQGKSLETAAAEAAEQWRKGLESWNLGKSDLERLSDSAEWAVYTPGSSSGIPVNILASFEAPGIPWQENEEGLRDKISSVVTAILSLVGFKDIDPLRSREHILLSNLVENAWRAGKSLDLSDLILQTQNPPFSKLGAFPLDDFFPERDRDSLAMLLNNFLASPSFQVWIQGETLEIEKFLQSANGKPRHSIFYIAHLNDTERMFFVTLLFAAVESWMRKQRGTGDLRALLYFDEIHGYLPPVANPPSKPLMIRMLKQARAFGLGLVLATQNPVDLDYKALSNAGTWMIGRLQTDQDKQRLLDGLESAAGGVSRAEFDRLLSALGKRVFLYQNVHEKKPEVFTTRWVLNYLAGPLTLTQVPALNQLAGAAPRDTGSITKPKAVPSTKTTSDPVRSAARIPSAIPQFYWPKASGELKAALLATAEVRYFSRTPSINTTRSIARLIDSPQSGAQNWDSSDAFDPSGELLDQVPAGAKTSPVADFLNDRTWWEKQRKDFEQWVYETDTATIKLNKGLNISAGPEIGMAAFKQQVKDMARVKAEQEIKKNAISWERKKLSAQNKIEQQQLRVENAQREVNSRRLQTASRGGQAVLDILIKRRTSKISSSIDKFRMQQNAEAKLTQAKQVLNDLQEDLVMQQKQMDQENELIRNKWQREAELVEEVQLTPSKQNIKITKFGIIWF